MIGRNLVRYDAACRALADTKVVDEVKDVRDQALNVLEGILRGKATLSTSGPDDQPRGKRDGR